MADNVEKKEKKGVCHNCESRFVGCHSNCVQYLDWRQKYDAERKIIREKKDKMQEQRCFQRESRAREVRRRGTR